jgi:hypothetical protein
MTAVCMAPSFDYCLIQPDLHDNLALCTRKCLKFVHRMFFSHNCPALPWSCDHAGLAQ